MSTSVNRLHLAAALPAIALICPDRREGKRRFAGV
jgi:hypothetical protein